jgi:hypothetical protein
MSVERNWNLNETLGRVAKTGIVESAINLQLGLKRVDGSKETVGRFRLPLNSLADGGFVTRRVIEGHRIFDVQILRELDGSYSIGVHQGRSTPLAPYAVP